MEETDVREVLNALYQMAESTEVLLENLEECVKCMKEGSMIAAMMLEDGKGRNRNE